MWATKAEGDDDDVDDVDDMNNKDNDGHSNVEPVLIYQPILGSGRRHSRHKPGTVDDGCFGTTVTYSGGGGGGGNVCFFCPSCHDPLFQLVQVRTPTATAARTAKTLQVFACNRASCIRGLFPSVTTSTATKEEDVSDGSNSIGSHNGRNVLCYGGGDGVVLCRRLADVEVVDPTKATMSMTTTTINSHSNANSTTNSVDDENNNTQLPLELQREENLQENLTNEWAAADDDKDCSDGELLDDLESKLVDMETSTTTKAKTALSGRANNKKKNNNANVDGNQHDSTSRTAELPNHRFPCWELHSLREPPSLVNSSEGDDVGIGNGRDDRKIQRMLQSYLAVEDDPDILAALSQRGGGIMGKGGGGGERDERLSATDRALLTFTDRLKRAPRQVLRYAPGGVPLWSVYVFFRVGMDSYIAAVIFWFWLLFIRKCSRLGKNRMFSCSPLTLSSFCYVRRPLLDSSETKPQTSNKRQPKKANQQQTQRRTNVSKMYGVGKPIPPCPLCGTPREFEVQLLPSLLHVLEVDKHVQSSSSSAENNNNNSSSSRQKSPSLALAFENGGMDWGNIAIYTCPNGSCIGPVEEYCVVQDSVDERPTVRATAMGQQQGDTVTVGAIQPESLFEGDDDDDEDDDEEGEGMILDDDDDGSVW